MDRESVITHLMILHTWAAFALERDLNFFEPVHIRKIKTWTDEAVILLKNPVLPEWKDGKAYCGDCGKRIPKKIGARFCYKCGRRILWNENEPV